MKLKNLFSSCQSLSDDIPLPPGGRRAWPTKPLPGPPPAPIRPSRAPPPTPRAKVMKFHNRFVRLEECDLINNREFLFREPDDCLFFCKRVEIVAWEGDKCLIKVKDYQTVEYPGIGGLKLTHNAVYVCIVSNPTTDPIIDWDEDFSSLLCTCVMLSPREFHLSCPLDTASFHIKDLLFQK